MAEAKSNLLCTVKFKQKQIAVLKHNDNLFTKRLLEKNLKWKKKVTLHLPK